jgi:hypothetical protein
VRGDLGVIVHQHGAGFEALGDLPGAGDVAAPDRRAQPVLGSVRLGDRVLDIGERDDREHRAELLLVDQSHAGTDTSHDRRREVVPRPVVRGAAGDGLAAVVERVLHQLADPLILRPGRHRRESGSRPHLGRLGDGRELGDQVIVNRRVHQHPLDSRAGLAAEHERGAEQQRGHLLDIDIAEDDGSVVTAELGDHPLHRLPGRCRYPLAGRHASSEGDKPDAGVGHQRGADGVVAREHVEHAWRHDVLPQLPEPQGGQRGKGRRLGDHGIAEEEGGEDLLRDDEPGCVPRRDRRHHAHWRTLQRDRLLVVVLDDVGRDRRGGDVPPIPDGRHQLRTRAWNPLFQGGELVKLGEASLDRIAHGVDHGPPRVHVRGPGWLFADRGADSAVE